MGWEVQDGTRGGNGMWNGLFCYTLDGELQRPRILNSNQCFCLLWKDRTYLRVYWLYLQHLNILTYSMRASICTLSLGPTNVKASLHKNELRNSYWRKRTIKKNRIREFPLDYATKKLCRLYIWASTTVKFLKLMIKAPKF